MTLIVDIRDWLDEDDCLPDHPLRLRRNALRIVTFIEYGGELQQLEGRETLVPCKRRPHKQQCLGLLWVMKRADDRIEARCPFCLETEAIVSGWQDTQWAHGPMDPLPMTDD